MLEELIKIREDLFEHFQKGDMTLIGFDINNLDTFIFKNQDKLKL